MRQQTGRSKVPVEWKTGDRRDRQGTVTYLECQRLFFTTVRVASWWGRGEKTGKGEGNLVASDTGPPEQIWITPAGSSAMYTLSPPPPPACTYRGSVSYAACSSLVRAHSPLCARLAHSCLLRRWRSQYTNRLHPQLRYGLQNNSIKKKKNTNPPFCFVKIVRTALRGPADCVLHIQHPNGTTLHQPHVSVTCSFWRARVTFCWSSCSRDADLNLSFCPFLGGSSGSAEPRLVALPFAGAAQDKRRTDVYLL